LFALYSHPENIPHHSHKTRPSSSVLSGREVIRASRVPFFVSSLRQIAAYLWGNLLARGKEAWNRETRKHLKLEYLGEVSNS
jgi:hypothetical protein